MKSRTMFAFVAVVSLLTSLAIVAPANAVATTHWHATGDQLDAASISCPANQFCMAVGQDTYQSGNGVDHQDPTAEIWNGQYWGETPLPKAGGVSELSSVSCAASWDCDAVGVSGSSNSETRQALYLHWNGIEWRRVLLSARPGAKNLGLDTISCRPDRTCVAVGSDSTGPVAYRWSGGRLKRIGGLDTVLPTGADFLVLTDLSCTSDLNCWLSGSATYIDQNTGNSRYQPILAHWQGETRWTATPAALTGTNSAIAALACPQANMCVALQTLNVGSTSHQRILGFDGTQWAPTGTVFPASYALDAMWCGTVSNCYAVGTVSSEDVNNPAVDTVVEHLIGNRWTRESSPQPDDESESSSLSALSDVACMSASRCFAVGYLTLQRT